MKHNIIKYSIAYLFFASLIIGCPHDNNPIIEITTEKQLENLLANSQGPSAISFQMPQCEYCIKMHSLFEDLAKNDLFSHITFYKVNGVALHAYIHVKKFLNEIVTGYPTTFFMNNGKVTSKQIGGAQESVIIQHLNNTTSQKNNQNRKNNIKLAAANKKYKKGN